MAAHAILLSLAVAAAGMPGAGGVSGVITPSGPEVPANLLRIEVHFDRPMPGIAQQAITLRDGAGNVIDDALLDISLPDRDERNLVVLMQPGRIKHGVGPNLALGPALHEGERIDIEVRDRRLSRPLTRAWRVGAPAAQALTPAAWALRAPPARARSALTLSLPSPVNASAVALIALADGDGRRVAGKASLGAGETEWRFVPAAPWKGGRYQVRIHPALEDPAGNRLCAPFEASRQSELRCDEEVRLAFRIDAPRPSPAVDRPGHTVSAFRPARCRH